QAWYAAAGITIERVISDNGACYRSAPWAATCARLGIIHKRTRPCRPQTNGKVERFHSTLADEWARARPCNSETQRRAALDPWPHMYNHHRAHRPRRLKLGHVLGTAGRIRVPGAASDRI